MTRWSPRLVAITDRQRATAQQTLERFATLARAARPGSVVFQLRDLELPVRERLAFGHRLAALARVEEQLFVVNDRVDLAVLLGADGVHLGEGGIATTDARRLLGEQALVSRACHDPSRVPHVDADLVLLSPVLEPRKARPALGLEGFGTAVRLSAAASTRRLVFALGGVTAVDARACLSAGADGVAMMGAILGTDELSEVVAALGVAR